MAIGDAHLKTIGLVVVHFAEVERALARFIGFNLLDKAEPDERLIILNQLSFRRQLDLLGALFILRVDNKRLVQSLKSVLRKLASAESTRNQMMHSQWELPDREVPYTTARYKPSVDRFKGLRHSFEEMSLTDFRRVTRSFDTAISDLRRLEDEYWKWKLDRKRKRK